MSAQLYYSIPNTNQRSPSTMAYSDNSGLLAGARRRSPPQQGFGPGGINMYHQQQIQTALYQQQQIEFAQQQAQLEMHLQLEQMRLQNLALQEQIMIGQAHAHQAHAQAQAEQQQQLHNTFYSTNKAPAPGRMTFTQGQGGMLAERALARRQQAEADALYAQCYPNVEEEDDVLRELGHGPPFSSVSSERSSNLTPPAVVVSKPDEAFPLLASADAMFSKAPGFPKLTNQHASLDFQTDSLSATPSLGSVSPPSSTDNSQTKDSAAVPIKKKFSDVLKSSAPKSTPTPPANSNATTGPPPKLNPFSSVFVPGSNNSPESEAPAPVSKSSPTQKVVSFTEPAPESAASPGVYRAPRAKSPPSAKGNRVSVTPLAPTLQSVPGGMPTRQPRGPAAEAELTNQNFATRIRKRAIGAIKTLGPRPPTSPSPVSTASATNYHYYQQQQMLEAMMMQQHQQHALAAAGYVDSDLGFHSAMHSSGGIAHLMATARAREERFGY
ncbi:hypothetical protein PtA15_18A54 [Puccinia triticina]|uniref:Uncharacterized protein n=1 Tax=Puccinia triticina TaxID=208348 RepID=A0ABY7D8T3_9BASI|nr:uncharacterized protein PtA15_18A54 [Puccinia triticina]WAQ92998.1 hypothetical protein PtA15_18A54 [Puccinia triticina]